MCQAVALDICVYNVKNIFQIYTNCKMLQIFNTNDDYTNNDTKYLREQYDLLSLLICDNPKNDDEESSDATMNSIITGRDTNSNYLHDMAYIESVCYSTVDHGTVSIEVLHKPTFHRCFNIVCLFQGCFNIVFVW